MDFKDKVKAVRARLFITQDQLARELGCTPLMVLRWENGKKPPSFILEAKFNQFCVDKNIRFEE